MRKGIERILFAALSLCILSLTSYNVLKKADLLSVSGAKEEQSVYYTQSVLYKSPHIITLSLSAKYEDRLRINGEAAEYKKNEQGYIELTVYEADVVAIDLTDVSEEVSVFIADADDEVKVPKVGTKLFVHEGIHTLFVINTTENVD